MENLLESGIVLWIGTGTKSAKSFIKMAQRRLSEVETLRNSPGQVTNIISHYLDCIEANRGIIVCTELKK